MHSDSHRSGAEDDERQAQGSPALQGILEDLLLLPAGDGFRVPRRARCPEGRRADLVGASPPLRRTRLKGPGSLLWRSPRAAHLRSWPSCVRMIGVREPCRPPPSTPSESAVVPPSRHSHLSHSHTPSTRPCSGRANLSHCSLHTPQLISFLTSSL